MNRLVKKKQGREPIAAFFYCAVVCCTRLGVAFVVMRQTAVLAPAAIHDFWFFPSVHLIVVIARRVSSGRGLVRGSAGAVRSMVVVMVVVVVVSAWR